MDEVKRDESLQRVHPGYCTVFPTGEQQKHKQWIVNNGKRKSAELLANRTDGVESGAGETVQTAFTTKYDVTPAGNSEGGKRIIANLQDTSACSGLSFVGYGLETGTAARLALTITLTLTDTGFAVLTLLLGYRRRAIGGTLQTWVSVSKP